MQPSPVQKHAAHLREAFVLVFLLCVCTEAFGSRAESSESEDQVEREKNVRDVPRKWLSNTTMFSVRSRPEKPRSAFWFPLLCFGIPGLDQWIEGQWLPAAAYSGIAAAGYAYADYVQRSNGVYEHERVHRISVANDEPIPDDLEDKSLHDSKNSTLRKVALASQVAQWSGGMSTYHSFRTAVRTRKQLGEYAFLEYEETPWDLMAAPFRIQYLLRATTLIPLAIIGGLSALNLSQPDSEDSDLKKDRLSSEDGFYAGAFSYNAGTHEEAVFRGWLQPWFVQQLSSPFWGNGAQALVFGAAHLNTVPVPIVQTLLGFHLGYVTQKNGYRLGEAIFIHAWWDVVAFAASYSYRERQAYFLPPLEVIF